MPCTICCDAFNLTTKKMTKCPYCDIEVCMTCNKKYLIESIQDPHCMNCMKVWPLAIFKNMVPFVFITKDYKNHRENVLFEREVARLPETQVYADNIITVRKLETKRNEIHQNIDELYQEIGNLNQEIRARNGSDYSKNTKKTYIRSCPGEGCRGFLDTDWNCSICLTKVCSKCHEIMHHDHTCDEAILENVKAITASTKPCPTCGIPTFKINGCNQMWCTGCHTTWCWASGLVEKGVVHNPHYYEYLRQQSVNGEIPRNALDQPCDENLLITSRVLLNYLTKQKASKNSAYVVQQMTIHRNMVHLAYYMHQYHTEDIEEVNRKLRVKYIMNEIDEENFKIVLQKQEKLRTKKNAIWEILNTFNTVVIDIFHRAIQCKNITEYDTTIQEIRPINAYCNNLMGNVKIAYKCKVPIICANNYEIEME